MNLPVELRSLSQKALLRLARGAVRAYNDNASIADGRLIVKRKEL